MERSFAWPQESSGVPTMIPTYLIVAARPEGGKGLCPSASLREPDCPGIRALSGQSRMRLQTRRTIVAAGEIERTRLVHSMMSGRAGGRADLMGSGQSGIVLRQIRTLWDEGRVGALTDEQLLERFAARCGVADEAAFEALILRHGPMVLGVCRRVLRDPHEAEDAFQATFLILARQAGSIRKGEVLGGWLCRVAYRVAARSRALAARRGPIEAPGRIPSAGAPPDELAERDDLCAAILEEVQLLPEKYRLPVQLCYLEGRTHDEAALQLAWPVGTVRTRLGWARDRLRVNLARRGLALSAGLVGTALISLKASAEVPAPLVEATVGAAVGRATGTAATALAAGVLRATLMSRLKLAVLLIVAGGSLAGVALPYTLARIGRAGPAVAVAGRGRGQEAVATSREVRTVFFRVVDRKTKQPIPGVTLKVWIDGKMVRQQVTDESGRMVIPLPEKEPERLTVTAGGTAWSRCGSTCGTSPRGRPRSPDRTRWRWIAARRSAASSATRRAGRSRA